MTKSKKLFMQKDHYILPTFSSKYSLINIFFAPPFYQIVQMYKIDNTENRET